MNDFRFSHWTQLATLFVLILALLYLAWVGWGLLPGHSSVAGADFSGDRALTLAQEQCNLGPRPSGSDAGWRAGNWIADELQRQGWNVQQQQFNDGSMQLRNIIAKGNENADGPVLVIATHYDTRVVSDLDPDISRRKEATMGANDGASGVAVMLELARSLDVSNLSHRVWLVFLDGEANSGVPGWEGMLGSRAFSRQHHPAAVIYLNKVGAVDAQFPKYPDATALLQTQIWKLAGKLGFRQQFISQFGPEVINAHTVFLKSDIDTANIVQPGYIADRTTLDNCDQLSANTLTRVGGLLERYLESDSFSIIAPSLKKAFTVTP